LAYHTRRRLLAKAEKEEAEGGGGSGKLTASDVEQALSEALKSSSSS
jgi:hypothetical protein